MKNKKIIQPKNTKLRIYNFKDYEEYCQSQIRTNLKRFNRIWASEKELDIISTFIKQNILKVKFGICHGVRNGWEVQFLKTKLNINIIGTELSNAAKNIQNIIIWDFHDTKPEWINNTDFIYSNALDHSYNPLYCLDQWMSCIKKNGYCFIEWTSQGHNRYKNPNRSDCFQASKEEYIKLIENKYKIKKIFKISKKIVIFAIKHK